MEEAPNPGVVRLKLPSQYVGTSDTFSVHDIRPWLSHTSRTSMILTCLRFKCTRRIIVCYRLLIASDLGEHSANWSTFLTLWLNTSAN